MGAMTTVLLKKKLTQDDGDEDVDNDDKNEKDDGTNWNLRENILNTILSCR